MTIPRLVVVAISVLVTLAWGDPCRAQSEVEPDTALGWSGVDAQEAGDFVRAAELYRQACDAGDGAACALVGSMYTRRNQGVEPDADLALALFLKGCEAGNSVACGAAEQMKARLPAAQRQEEADDIANTSDADENATDSPAPAPVDVEAMQHACGAGVVLTCLELGYIYRDGIDTPSNPAGALAMFQKACALSDSTDAHETYACHVLAALHESGDGVPRDLGRALVLYEKACSAGNDDSCSQARVVRLSTGR